MVIEGQIASPPVLALAEEHARRHERNRSRSLQTRVRLLLGKDRSVQAVKEVRLATGLGRKEAKQLVDALRDGPLTDSDHRKGARWRAASRTGPGGSTPVDTSV
jgi:ribosomal protein L7/L12